MRAIWAVVVAGCGRIGFDPSAPDDPQILDPAACTPLAHGSPVISVQSVAELEDAVATAAPGSEIAIASGRYLLTDQLRVATPSLTLRSASGRAADVVIEVPDGVREGIHVFASDVAITELTIANVDGDGLDIEATMTADITGVAIHDVTLQDNQAGVRIRPFMSMVDVGPFADAGVVSCSRVIATDQTLRGCTDVDVFGVRGLAARDWTVRNNVFDRQACTASSDNRIVWFGEGSRDTAVVGNRFAGGAFNLMFGAFAGRTYPDPLPAACSGAPPHWGGLACNNVIDSIRVPAISTADFSEGIAVWGGCDTWVLHNTIGSPPPSEALNPLEYRFQGSFTHFAGNLTRTPPAQRDGGGIDDALAPSNATYSDDAVFIDVARGDFHLRAPGATSDRITMFEPCLRDADGTPRNSQATAGAYER